MSYGQTIFHINVYMTLTYDLVNFTLAQLCPKVADTVPQLSRELEVAHTRNRYQTKEEHLGIISKGFSKGAYGALRAPQAR